MEMNEKIKFLRTQKGLTLEQVGDYVGVSKATVLKWESGYIQNMRRDKISKLAHILGTTPDFLLGWTSPSDRWNDFFRGSLKNEMETISEADCEAAGVDYDKLSMIADGSVSQISLSEACTIADDLGCSLDEMVGIEKSAEISGQMKEFVDLFSRLTEDQKAIVISSIKGILNNQ